MSANISTAETCFRDTDIQTTICNPFFPLLFTFTLLSFRIWKYKRTLETDETRYEMVNLLAFAIAFIRPDWMHRANFSSNPSKQGNNNYSVVSQLAS